MDYLFVIEVFGCTVCRPVKEAEGPVLIALGSGPTPRSSLPN